MSEQKFYRVETYEDDQNRTILARTQVMTTGMLKLDGTLEFFGNATVHAMSPKGTVSVPVPPFKIEAKTIEEAFAGLEAAAEKAREAFIKEKQAEQKKNQLSNLGLAGLGGL